MLATSETALDQALAELCEQARPFARAATLEKAAWLRQIRERFYELAPRMVEEACRVKGVQLGSALEGEEWFAGPLVVLRSLRQLADSLEQIARSGAPVVSAERIRARPGGGVAVRTIPHDRVDGLLFAPYAARLAARPASWPRCS